MKNYRYLLFLIMVITVQLNAQDMVPYREGNKWGFSDREGNIKIKAEYDSVGFFTENRAIVERNNLYGFIDTTGKLVIDIKFRSASPFYSNMSFVQKDTNSYCIDRDEKIKPCLFICGGSLNFIMYFQTYRKDGKIGFVNWKYDSILNTYLADSNLTSWEKLIENNGGQAAVSNGKKWSVIDVNNNLLSAEEYDSIIVASNLPHEYHFIVKKNGQYGLLDQNGKELIRPKYYKVSLPLKQGLLRVWTTDSFWFYADVECNEYYKK